MLGACPGTVGRGETRSPGSGDAAAPSAVLHAGAPSAVTPQGSAAPASGDAGVSPVTRFALISQGKCPDRPRVLDMGGATLVIDPTLAHLYRPGETAPVDLSSQLPRPRGTASLFAAKPPVIAVEKQKWTPIKPDTRNRLGYFLFSPERLTFTRVPVSTFGDYPTALPVETGTVVASLSYREKATTDRSYLVPAGNGSEARWIGMDGSVTELKGWPGMLYFELVSSPHVIWGTCTRPGRAGQFLLRMPLSGSARFYPIPGTLGCRGEPAIRGPAAPSGCGQR